MSVTYYIVMQNFGEHGQEAMVNPEETRAQIVQDIANGRYENVAYIHHINMADGRVEDATKEILSEAVDCALVEVLSLNKNIFDLCQKHDVIGIGYSSLEDGRLIPYQPEPKRRFFDPASFAFQTLSAINKTAARVHGGRP